MDAPIQAPAGQADPAQGGAASDSDSGGYVIEIEVDGSGKITVNCESSAQEGAEDASPGAEGTESGASAGTPAKDIKDALTMALQCYKSNGKMPTAGADEADFNAGYSAKNGSPGQPQGM